MTGGRWWSIWCAVYGNCGNFTTHSRLFDDLYPLPPDSTDLIISFVFEHILLSYLAVPHLFDFLILRFSSTFTLVFSRSALRPSQPLHFISSYFPHSKYLQSSFSFYVPYLADCQCFIFCASASSVIAPRYPLLCLFTEFSPKSIEFGRTLGSIFTLSLSHTITIYSLMQ